LGSCNPIVIKNGDIYTRLSRRLAGFRRLGFQPIQEEAYLEK
jgi:hypothetical protein